MFKKSKFRPNWNLSPDRQPRLFWGLMNTHTNIHISLSSYLYFTCFSKTNRLDEGHLLQCNLDEAESQKNQHIAEWGSPSALEEQTSSANEDLRLSRTIKGTTYSHRVVAVSAVTVMYYWLMCFSSSIVSAVHFVVCGNKTLSCNMLQSRQLGGLLAKNLLTTLVRPEKSDKHEPVLKTNVDGRKHAPRSSRCPPTYSSVDFSLCNSSSPTSLCLAFALFSVTQSRCVLPPPNLAMNSFGTRGITLIIILIFTVRDNHRKWSNRSS